MVTHTFRPLSQALSTSLKAIVVSTVACYGIVAQADRLDEVMNVGEARIAAAQDSQKKVDSIADQTNDLLQTFKQVTKEIEGLRVYNAQLEARIANQVERIADIDESIANVKVVQRQIPPLLERMLEGLESFVELDVPFHLEERQARVERLRANMGQSNQSVAEVFRQVLEAYKIENEYGRKIEAYEDAIDFNDDGNERKVDVFRVGRIALMYRTEDGAEVGRWDNQSRSWESLSAGEWSDKVNTGIKIARNQAVKDILTLPIAAPEAAQ